MVLRSEGVLLIESKPLVLVWILAAGQDLNIDFLKLVHWQKVLVSSANLTPLRRSRSS